MPASSSTHKGNEVYARLAFNGYRVFLYSTKLRLNITSKGGYWYRDYDLNAINLLIAMGTFEVFPTPEQMANHMVSVESLKYRAGRAAFVNDFNYQRLWTAKWHKKKVDPI